MAKMTPRNSNASLKRRINGVGGFHDFPRQDLRYMSPPQKQARTRTQFESANFFKVPLYHNNSVPRVSRRYDNNFQFVSDSFGRVSASNVRNNATRNHSPFVSVSTQSMINPNYHHHHLPSHNLPGFRAFASETASHQQKHHDNSFDSLPEWDPNEPTTSRIQTGFVSNIPVINFSNQSLNSLAVPTRQNNISDAEGNMVCVPTQVMSNPIQSWVGNDFSDLLNTLKNKGLVSLSDDGREKTEINKHGDDDSILGIEFDPSLLKVRHESVINALYSDLPRQCSSCGLRFKCQEEHRNHMDWHVRKNRIGKCVNQNKKNKKQVQKVKQSRKWFAGAGLWLSAVTGENVDDKVIAELFNAGKENKKNEDDEEKEFVVPADDDQKTCALCKEPFEDFFSDEADEWMYRGAVYLNKETRTMTTTMTEMTTTTTGKRSILGPIVHVKCMPETTVNTA